MCSSDDQDVRRCLDGQPDAFRHLVQRYEVPLQRYLVGKLGNDDEASEVAQETFVRAYFALPKLRKSEVFFSWLLGIAGRTAKEFRRHQRHRRQVALGEAELADVADPVEERPDQSIARAVAGLPEPYRQVILMRYYGGLSCGEVSRHLGVPLGTVTKQLSRAYAMLRESLLSPSEAEDREVKP
jgi:RNA polymerase sigma-70 factor (ECF subfamily)